MSTITLQLPDSLHIRAEELAHQDHISIQQLIMTALAEKIAALDTVDYLKERAKRGDRAKFEKAMSKVADIEPEEYDHL